MTRAEVNRLYAGVNGYDPYKITVTTPSYAWVKYAVAILIAIGLRFLCCA